MLSLSGLSLNELFAVSAIVNGVTSFVMAIVALSSTSRSRSTWVFSAYMAAVTVWSVGYFFWMRAHSDAAAYFWITVLNVGSAFIPICAATSRGRRCRTRGSSSAPPGRWS
jgi:hypothetical protein